MAIDNARAKSLFLSASDLPDPAVRVAFLDRECGGDVALRNRVEALLRANEVEPVPSREEVGGTSAYTPSGQQATAEHGDPTARIGAVLAGKYRLVEEIGAGGMGSVFLAQQTEPVKRTVAIKVIKAGMDSRAVLARFEAERQALAMMDHPNIAKVLDAGTTDGGRPFFVMELVKGLPITRFCDERKLTPRRRLELFVPVCQAIQHAHQKGIIHRDIKPSNVLVALYDDRPVPKVIDFGVAKATGSALTDHSLLTGFGAIVGTPEYMSPEQASFNNLDVDTRSDVYSLGVLLYELLTGTTGTTPVDRQGLGQAAMLEVLRIVREVEAPKPSAKLSTIDTLPSVAANRGTEPAKLSKLMKGELDWLVLKALEKDRTRRYETANALSRDIQRYLADEVVEARPPSAGYRLQKFVRRHKGQVIAASLVAVALVAGIIGTTWQARRAEQARADEAEQRSAAEENERRAVAAAEKEREARLANEAAAKAVVRFFEDKVFAAGRPKGQEGGLGHDVSLRDAIEASLPALANSFEDQPLVEARLRETLGITFIYLGKAAQSAEQLERAYALYLRGPEDVDTLGSMHNLANAYAAQGRETEALKLREHVFATERRLRPPDHPSVLNSLQNLAASYQALGRLDEAHKLKLDALAAVKRVLPPDHPRTLTAMHNLANSYHGLGRYAEAVKLFEEALAGRQRVLPRPPDHPDTLGTMSNLAIGYEVLNRPQDALRLREEVLAARKRVLPPDHPDILAAMNNLAEIYATLKQHAAALKLREETLAGRRRVLSSNHPETLLSMSNLAKSYEDLGRFDEALQLQEEVLTVRRQSLPPDHPDTLRSMQAVASTYRKTGRRTEATRLFEETLAAMKRALPADHPHTLAVMHELAGCHLQQNHYAAALKLYEETLAGRKRSLPPDHLNTLFTMHDLANCLRYLNRHAEALRLHEETLVARKRALPPNHPYIHDSLNSVAIGLLQNGQRDDARRTFEELIGLQERSAAEVPNVPGYQVSLGGSYCNLGEVLADDGKHAESLPWYDKAVATLSGVHAQHPRHAMAKSHLCNSLEGRARARDRLRHYEDALRDLDRAIALNQPDMLPLLRANRAVTLLHAGRTADAQPDIAHLYALGERFGSDTQFDSMKFHAAARLFALASAKVPDKRQEYADRAMALLLQAVKAGYSNAAELRADSDFDAVRERADFQKLLADLEAKGAAEKP